MCAIQCSSHEPELDCKVLLSLGVWCGSLATWDLGETLGRFPGSGSGLVGSVLV